MSRLLRTTALGLALGFFLPLPGAVTGIVFNPSAYADPFTGQIPSWIKASCCGPQDAHHLQAEQVHDEGDYYTVDGYHGNGGKIAHRLAVPSQDGDYWIFYGEGRTLSGGDVSQTGVYCFFIPMAF